MMKNIKPNAELVWKQFEDLVVPRLRLNIVDRAVYSHLLRHSRLEGKVRLQFSIPWLARAARLTTTRIPSTLRPHSKRLCLSASRNLPTAVSRRQPISCRRLKECQQVVPSLSSMEENGTQPLWLLLPVCLSSALQASACI
jgi:hypothetical protein